MANYSCFSLREIWIFLISSKKSLIKSTIDYWIRIRREIIHFLQSPVTNVCIEVLQDIFPQDFVLHRFFSFFPLSLSLSPYSLKAQVQIELINEIFFYGKQHKKIGLHKRDKNKNRNGNRWRFKTFEGQLESIDSSPSLSSFQQLCLPKNG